MYQRQPQSDEEKTKIFLDRKENRKEKSEMEKSVQDFFSTFFFLSLRRVKKEKKKLWKKNTTINDKTFPRLFLEIAHAYRRRKIAFVKHHMLKTSHAQ